MGNFELTLSEPVERGSSADAALRAVRGYAGGQADGNSPGSVTAGRYQYLRDDSPEDVDGDIHAALLSVDYTEDYRVVPVPGA